MKRKGNKPHLGRMRRVLERLDGPQGMPRELLECGHEMIRENDDGYPCSRRRCVACLDEVVPQDGPLVQGWSHESRGRYCAHYFLEESPLSLCRKSERFPKTIIMSEKPSYVCGPCEKRAFRWSRVPTRPLRVMAGGRQTTEQPVRHVHGIDRTTLRILQGGARARGSQTIDEAQEYPSREHLLRVTFTRSRTRPMPWREIRMPGFLSLREVAEVVAICFQCPPTASPFFVVDGATYASDWTRGNLLSSELSDVLADLGDKAYVDLYFASDRTSTPGRHRIREIGHGFVEPRPRLKCDRGRWDRPDIPGFPAATPFGITSVNGDLRERFGRRCYSSSAR